MKKQNKTIVKSFLDHQSESFFTTFIFSQFMFCTYYGHYTINYSVIHVGIFSNLQRNGYEAEISYLKYFRSNVLKMYVM